MLSVIVLTKHICSHREHYSIGNWRWTGLIGNIVSPYLESQVLGNKRNHVTLAGHCSSEVEESSENVCMQGEPSLERCSHVMFKAQAKIPGDLSAVRSRD